MAKNFKSFIEMLAPGQKQFGGDEDFKMTFSDMELIMLEKTREILKLLYEAAMDPRVDEELTNGRFNELITHIKDL